MVGGRVAARTYIISKLIELSDTVIV